MEKEIIMKLSNGTANGTTNDEVEPIKPIKIKIRKPNFKLKISFAAIGKAFLWIIVILTILATFIGPLLSAIQPQ